MTPKKKVVVLVDDQDIVRRALTRVLRTADVAVLEAEDGVAAITLLEVVEPPALIVTDGEMPRMNGLELIKTLRMKPVLARIPIILASANPAFCAEATKLGVPTHAKTAPMELRELVKKMVHGASTTVPSGP